IAANKRANGASVCQGRSGTSYRPAKRVDGRCAASPQGGCCRSEPQATGYDLPERYIGRVHTLVADRPCVSLEQAGALSQKAKNRFQAFTVEIQAELNFEILEHMDGIEMEDWARGGRVREKWEKYLRDEPERP